MSTFPIPAPAFEGRSRAVGVGTVFAWLGLGWSLFAANPLLWVGCTLTLIVGAAVLLAVWLLGPLLAMLLAPVLAGSLLGMCRKAASGRDPAFSDLLEGFRTQTGPLMLLGVIYLLGVVVIALLTFGLLGLLGLLGGGLAHSGFVGMAVVSIGVLWIVSPLLTIPLWMLMWFAPALVLFNGMPPVAACKASFGACLKNFLPFVVLALIAFVMSFFAALPLGLGFLVLIPVLAGTAYASYQDVFVTH